MHDKRRENAQLAFDMFENFFFFFYFVIIINSFFSIPFHHSNFFLSYFFFLRWRYYCFIIKKKRKCLLGCSNMCLYVCNVFGLIISRFFCYCYCCCCCCFTQLLMLFGFLVLDFLLFLSWVYLVVTFVFSRRLKCNKVFFSSHWIFSFDT